MLSQSSLSLSSFRVILFSFCCSAWVLPLLSSKLLVCSSASSNLLIPSSIFFISFVLFLISDWFFFRFSLCLSPLLSSLVGIFITIALNSLIFFIQFFPKAFFIWSIFPSLFILFDFLCFVLWINRKGYLSQSWRIGLGKTAHAWWFWLVGALPGGQWAGPSLAGWLWNPGVSWFFLWVGTRRPPPSGLVCSLWLSSWTCCVGNVNIVAHLLLSSQREFQQFPCLFKTTQLLKLSHCGVW